MKTDILYEDDDILVIYKPAGFGVQTAKAGQQDVVSELKNYLWQCRKQQGHSQAADRSGPYLGLIHRLDQPVEGLLVFAKNRKAAASLSEQLQKQEDGGTLHKQYYALLGGKPAVEKGELVDYLYKNKENRAEIAEGPGISGAKRAVLTYHVLQVFHVNHLSGDEIAENAVVMQSAVNAGKPGSMRTGERAGKPGSMRSAEKTGKPGSIQSAEGGKESGGMQVVLADIHIQTGRFHQIRAQMAHAGMPLLGDFKYGNEETKALSQQLNLQQVALCAYSLAFLHPVSGKEMRFQIQPRGRAFSYFT